MNLCWLRLALAVVFILFVLRDEVRHVLTRYNGNFKNWTVYAGMSFSIKVPIVVNEFYSRKMDKIICKHTDGPICNYLYIWTIVGTFQLIDAPGVFLDSSNCITEECWKVFPYNFSTIYYKKNSIGLI